MKNKPEKSYSDIQETVSANHRTPGAEINSKEKTNYSAEEHKVAHSDAKNTDWRERKQILL